MTNAVKFDGANDYLSIATNLSITDGKTGIFSAWIRLDGDQNGRLIYGKGGASFLVDVSSNKIRVVGINAAGTTILSIATTATYKASAKWLHVLAAWDLATTTTHLYTSDLADKTVTTATNDTIDYTPASAGYSIGATDTGTVLFDGALSEFYFAPGQYLDFSNTANRRKFIDAAGLPVDLGANGSTPTGTAPAVYLKGDKTGFGVNSGSGGNFTVNGTLETASTTPATLPAYNAVKFDGANDFLTRTTDLTGIADGKTGTISFWTRLDSTSVTNQFLANLSSYFGVAINSTPKFRITGLNASATLILDLMSAATYSASPVWIHVLASWDLATAAGHLYINGVSDLAASPTLSNDTINYATATPSWAIGENTSGSNKLNGCLSELWFNTSYLDLSVQANREKFILNGAPVSLGADGSTPTGASPLIYLPNRAALVGINAGTGGNFNISGSPKDANSTPVYYYAEPVKFDGSTAYLVRGGDLTGIADGKAGTVSFWMRIDTLSTFYLLSSPAATGKFYVAVVTNKINIIGRRAADATVILTVNSNTVLSASAVWVHVLASWDLASGSGHIYINNVSDIEASPTLTNDTIDYTDGNFGVGATTTGTSKFNGAIADLWFNTTYLDISQAGNRAKFIDQSTLRPVPLGAKGELPTGSQPLLYLGRDYANFGVNLGSGGNFT